MTKSTHTSDPIALENRDLKDGRLYSSSAGRNKADIADALKDMLPRDARVLEIGSGTGEHGIEALSVRPDVHWQFSDPDADSRSSQAAWITHQGYDLPAPIDLDARNAAWPEMFSEPFDVLYSANMIHIAPIEALKGLAAQADLVLTETGTIILYGPFLFGSASEPSNLKFDTALKDKNPTWGVRELDLVKHIFGQNGFNRVERRAMPKNNHIIGLSRG